MPNPPKIFIHDTVVLVTTRTEEGLPLVPTYAINMIIESALASANKLYPVNLIAFSFQLNHFHMLVHVIDPVNVSRFVGYVKQEIAHRLNRLLGRRKRTVWADGFDSPTILSPETVFQKIAYTLCNPVKDNVVKSLDESPFVSSWNLLKDERNVVTTKYIPRGNVQKLRNPNRAWQDDQLLLNHFREIDTEEIELKLCFYSWKYAFPELAVLSDTEIRSMIVHAVRLELETIEQERELTRRYVFNTTEGLRRQSLLRAYQPKQFGKRMLCLAINKLTRVPFIRFVQVLMTKAQKIKGYWLRGDYSLPYPPGLYPPGRAPMASIVPRAWCYLHC